MKNTKIDASRFLLAAIILFVLAGIIIAIYTLRSDPVDDILARNRVINILYIIEDKGKPLNTFVLMYYPTTQRAAIFDIPGNLGLLLSKVDRVDRIDFVYDSAKTAAFEAEVSKLLGIDMDFSIVIAIENLGHLVDLLEGVEIFIPQSVSYNNGESLVMFSSGMTVLDGDKASLYAAYTIPDEDAETENIRRQRFFLGFLNRQINMIEALKNPAVAKLYHSFLHTSMTQKTLIHLNTELANINTDRINIQSVSGNLREVSGQVLIIPHWDGNLVKEVVRQTLGTLTREVELSLGERSYTVEVLNGTAVSGLAGRTADMLRSFGYDIISIGNADDSNYEYTVIIHRLADETIVSAFADILRCNNIRSEYNLPEEENANNMDYKSDFTLIIGRNFNGRYVIGN